MIVRILLWNVADSKTTLEELRAQLPELADGDTWISNEAGERFGLVSFEDELPAGVTQIRDLIGRDPDVAEEFEAEG